MKKRFLKFLTIILAIGFFNACSDSYLEDPGIDKAELKSGVKNGLEEQENPLAIPDDERYLIGFSAGPDIHAVKNAGGKPYRTFNIVPAVAARLNEKAREALSRNPNVTYIEPDYKVFSTAQSVPWGVDRVFGIETYSFTTWTVSTGSGVSVAIIDTGIDSDHEDLPSIAGGTNTVGGSSYEDGDGHGTHVAGTVAGLDNTIGVVGVAPGVSLYAVKVLDDSGGGTVSSVVGGIEWAVENGIEVLNMSLGSSSGTETMRLACENAWQKGHIIVSSAGNSGNRGGGGDNVGYPAAYESVIAVAASTSADTRASFSSTGPAVELIAPGYQILSTLPDDRYTDTYSGTSMAAPHVTGVAALTWASNTTLTNTQVRDILRGTAEDLGLDANHQGYGLARADLAVAAATNNTGNQAPEAGFSFSATDLSVAFTDQSSDPDGSVVGWSWDFGDGSGSSTEQNPTYTYGTDGTYNVTLTVTDDDGATSSVSQEVTVAANSGKTAPSVDAFDASPNSNPAWTRATVTWSVSDADGDLASVVIEMINPDGKTASVTNTVSGDAASGSNELGFKKGTSGEHTINLTVTDAGGKTATQTIYRNL